MSPDVTVGHSTLNERTLGNWQNLQVNHDMYKENEEKTNMNSRENKRKTTRFLRSNLNSVYTDSLQK